MDTPRVLSSLLHLSILFVFVTHFGLASNVKLLLATYNEELIQFNHAGAEIAWEMSTHLGNTNLLDSYEELILKKNLWNNDWCIRLLNEKFENISDEREVYLICRGPRFSSYQLSNVLSILAKLRSVYDTHKVCLLDGKCYRMEPGLTTLMETTRKEPLLRNAWIKWHQEIGEELSDSYSQLIKYLNIGARQAGHSDIGVCWREEMETENIREKVIDLYSQVKHLFTLLHAYVRFKLENFYKIHLHNGTIPAHLLGNMWGQRWDSLINIIWPTGNSEEALDNTFIRRHIGRNVTVTSMVDFSNKFYINMGFPPLPRKFYENSYFELSNSSGRNCHGSAANMFGNNRDYRVMMCASTTDSDLQTLIHEVGHVHYFMAYESLPTVFQDGANAAFHEAVGDAVTYGLHPNPTIRELLKIGLFKLPQIGFGLVVDLWRWKVFEREDDFQEWNKLWWDLNQEFLGVRVPDGYRTEGLDALGKYHVVDNVPYIRYFYASFLQHIFYKQMCHGQRYCTLESRGKRFREMLSRGTSSHWSGILKSFTGSDEISAKPLLEYYKPLQIFLEYEVQRHQIPIGW